MEIYKGYVDELAKEGYHNGKNIKIEYQNANGDQSNLQKQWLQNLLMITQLFFWNYDPAAQALANSTKNTNCTWRCY